MASDARPIGPRRCAAVVPRLEGRAGNFVTRHLHQITLRPWLAFLIVALLATNYTVNRFYVLGAAMWDSGWYAQLAATGLRNPPAIGGWFLSDHMSLILVITSLIHQPGPRRRYSLLSRRDCGLAYSWPRAFACGHY